MTRAARPDRAQPSAHRVPGLSGRVASARTIDSLCCCPGRQGLDPGLQRHLQAFGDGNARTHGRSLDRTSPRNATWTCRSATRTIAMTAEHIRCVHVFRTADLPTFAPQISALPESRANSPSSTFSSAVTLPDPFAPKQTDVRFLARPASDNSSRTRRPPERLADVSYADGEALHFFCQLHSLKAITAVLIPKC